MKKTVLAFIAIAITSIAFADDEISFKIIYDPSESFPNILGVEVLGSLKIQNVADNNSGVNIYDVLINNKSVIFGEDFKSGFNKGMSHFNECVHLNYGDDLKLTIDSPLKLQIKANDKLITYKYIGFLFEIESIVESNNKPTPVAVSHSLSLIESSILEALNEVRKRTQSTNPNYVQDDFPNSFCRFYYSTNDLSDNICITLPACNKAFDPRGSVRIQRSIIFDELFLSAIKQNFPFQGNAKATLNQPYQLLRLISANYPKYKKWEAIAKANNPPPFNKDFSGRNIKPDWSDYADIEVITKDPLFEEYGRRVAFCWDGTNALIANVEPGQVTLLNSTQIDDCVQCYQKYVAPNISEVAKQYQKEIQINAKAKSNIDNLFR